MKCPACERELHEITVGDVLVDVCEGGCGGIWFDNFEIQKFDEPHEIAGEKLLDIACDETVVVDRTKRFDCPRCGNVVMMRHFFSAKREVEVDECPNCGGVWLDAGELANIRKEFDLQEKAYELARVYFSTALGHDLYAMVSRARLAR